MPVDRFPAVRSSRWFLLCPLLLLPLIGCASQTVQTSSRLSDASLQAGRSFNDCNGAGWCPTMVVVPAGH